jgi:hypothetical protein
MKHKAIRCLPIAFAALFLMIWVPALAQKIEKGKFDLKRYLDDPNWYPVKACKDDSCWMNDSMQVHGILPSVVDSSAWQWYRVQTFAWLIDPVSLEFFHGNVTGGYNLLFKKGNQHRKDQLVRLYGDGLAMEGCLLVLDDAHFELRLSSGKWIKRHQVHWKNDETKVFDYVLYERKKGIENWFRNHE